jgi:hypothetical protein
MAGQNAWFVGLLKFMIRPIYRPFYNRVIYPLERLSLQINELSRTVDEKIQCAEANILQKADEKFWETELNLSKSLRVKSPESQEIVHNLTSLLTVPPASEKKTITKRNLRLIAIGIFSFYNRRCWFCPNSFVDAHSENRFMPEKTFGKIISELKEMDFSGRVSYNRYNEPLADKMVLKRICETRTALPHAYLSTSTNGDYLDRTYLEQLADAGMDELEVHCEEMF